MSDAREKAAWAEFHAVPLLEHLGTVFGADDGQPGKMEALIEVAARVWKVPNAEAWDAATAEIQAGGKFDTTLVSGAGRYAFLCRAQRNVDNIWGDHPPFEHERPTWIWIRTVLQMMDEVRARKPRPWSPT